MPDRLTRVAACVAAYALAGAAAGVLWEWLWNAPDGIVLRDQWFLDPAGPDVAFQGAALYVVVALPVGLVLSVPFGLRRRHELVTVAAVLAASVLGALLMYAVGHVLGPPDPQALASGSDDLTAVPGDLVLTDGSTPDAATSPFALTSFSSVLLAMPSGAMMGLMLVYLLGETGVRRGLDRASDG